ncbi:hypothetical protein ACMFMF_007499 [Clarireedia jacksonii]
MQTRPSLLYQGLLLGLFINGIARWGFDSILQTDAALREDAQFGSLLPLITQTIISLGENTSSISFEWTSPSIQDSEDQKWGIDGISILVNDVERYRWYRDELVPVAHLFTWERNETGVPTLIKIALEPTTFRTFTTTKPTGTSNSLSITSTPAPISHTSTKTSLSTSTTATSPFNFFTSTSNSNSNSTSATSNNSTASHPAIIFHILGILIVVAMIGFLYLKCCWCRGRKKSKLAEAKARLDERNKMAQQQAEIANGRPGFAAAGNGNGYMMQQGYGYGYAPQPQMQQENANVTAPANAYPVRGAKRPMESEVGPRWI